MLAVSGPAAGDDSCGRALDGTCDEQLYGGTGQCPANTDSTDCGAGPNRCLYAFDGQCDEQRLGGAGACPAGTDFHDCMAARPVGQNACIWAFNRRCDEAQSGGSGLCALGTDTADCARAHPAADGCLLSHDGSCDEARYGGSGACAAGTDTADCSGVSEPSPLVFQIQSRLDALGYDPGDLDGQAGPATRDAIRRFQRDRGLPVTGQVTPGLLEILQSVR